MIIDEIKIYNGGSVVDPYPCMDIYGRDEKDWSKHLIIQICGTEEEDIQAELEDILKKYDLEKRAMTMEEYNRLVKEGKIWW